MCPFLDFTPEQAVAQRAPPYPGKRWRTWGQAGVVAVERFRYRLAHNAVVARIIALLDPPQPADAPRPMHS